MTLAVEEGSTFQVSKDTHTRKFGNELVILELSRGEYFSLDELGARIWNEVIAGQSVQHIVVGLVADYDEPADRLRADVILLLEDLVGRGLLVLRA